MGSSFSGASDRFGLCDVQPTGLAHGESAKWSMYGADVLPLWVADMDFPIAPSIRAALHERLEKSVGYAPWPGDDALTSMLLPRLELTGLMPRHVKYFPGVVPALFHCVRAFSSPGDRVVTFTPIYPPFLMSMTEQGRVPVKVPLGVGADGYRIDFSLLERAITESGAKLLLLCNPHNPTGRVWTVDELAQVAELAHRNEVLVVSDELHAGLTLDPEATPFVALHSLLSPGAREKLITLTGPCKTYNTAGLGIGVAVSHSEALMQALGKKTAHLAGAPSALAYSMWKAALREDGDAGEWLEAVLGQLRSNREQLKRWCGEHLAAPFYPPEATYLAWLDFRGHPQAGKIFQHFLTKAKVALSDGPPFGGPPGDGTYQGFLRLNFATTPAILGEALARLAAAMGK